MRHIGAAQVTDQLTARPQTRSQFRYFMSVEVADECAVSHTSRHSVLPFARWQRGKTDWEE